MIDTGLCFQAIVLFLFTLITGTVDGQAVFVKTKTPMNWTEAQKYCRTNYVDLARYGALGAL